MRSWSVSTSVSSRTMGDHEAAVSRCSCLVLVRFVQGRPGVGLGRAGMPMEKYTPEWAFPPTHPRREAGSQSHGTPPESAGLPSDAGESSASLAITAEGNSRVERSAVRLTQAQFVTAVADRADLATPEARGALAALDEIVLEELGNAQKGRIGGLV